MEEESNLPTDVWKYIMCYCDHYTFYFGLFATCNYFQKMVRELEQEYMKISFWKIHRMHFENLFAQLGFYEQVEPNRPWCKKLVHFYVTHKDQLPKRIKIDKAVKKRNRLDLPPFKQINPWTVQVGKNSDGFSINFQTNWSYNLNNPVLLGYFEVNVESKNSEFMFGFTDEGLSPDDSLRFLNGSIALCVSPLHTKASILIEGEANTLDIWSDEEECSTLHTIFGCGVLYRKEEDCNYIFFTRGKSTISPLIKVDVRNVGILKPTIELKSEDKVSVNLGQLPFAFKNWLELSKDKLNISRLVFPVELTEEEYTSESEHYYIDVDGSKHYFQEHSNPPPPGRYLRLENDTEVYLKRIESDDDDSYEEECVLQYGDPFDFIDDFEFDDEFDESYSDAEYY